MALGDGPLGELKIPLTLGAVIAVVIAGIVSVSLVLNARQMELRDEAYDVTREAVDTVSAPVGNVLSSTTRAGGSFSDTVSGYFFAGQQNQALKAQLRDMQRWKVRALALQDINERYRSLLELKIEPAVASLSARVLLDTRGPFSRARVLDVGSRQGITQGNPVLSDRGLSGRIVGVGAEVSRVMLLSDPASRVPVMIDRTNARALLVGDGSAAPRLEYVQSGQPLKPGDRIVTSGDGGIFPRGLPVGRAGKTRGGRWRVVLYSDEDKLDFVKVMLFKDFYFDKSSLPSAPKAVPPEGNLVPPTWKPPPPPLPPETPVSLDTRPAAPPVTNTGSTGGTRSGAVPAAPSDSGSGPPAVAPATPSAEPPAPVAGPSAEALL